MLLGILIPGLTVLLILKLCKYVESAYGGEIAFFTFIVISFGLAFLIKSYKKSRAKKILKFRIRVHFPKSSYGKANVS